MVSCSLQVDSFPAFPGTPVTDIPFRHHLGLNQQTYERLKSALSLNLRRQIFLAVCDDLPLRDRLAMQLQSELALSAVASTPTGDAATRAIPKLVTLDLNLDDPNPIAQMVEWLSYFPLVRTRSQPMPAFQLLGIERLTRQPAEVQSVFLAYLENIEQELPALESGLLLWMTQPWFRMLPEAAPGFWDCRTGVFEFIGDPTPLPTSSPERIRLHSSGAGAFTRPITGFISESSQTSAQAFPLPDAPDQNADPASDSTFDSTPDASIELPLDAALASDSSHSVRNPWLPLADDLNTWYEPELEESPATPLPHPTTDAQVDEHWIEVINQILEQELKGAAQSLQQDWQHSIPQPGQEPTTPPPVAETPLNAAVSVLVSHSLKPKLESDLEPNPATADTAHLSERQAQSNPDRPDANVANVSEQDHGAGDQAVPLLQHIELLQQQIALLEQGQESTTGLAIAYRTLGNFYRDCIEQGDASAENLTSAIQAYEQALRWLPEGTLEQAETLNDVANLYWMVAQYQTDPAEVILCLQQTEQIYQHALAQLTLPQHSQTYAMVQNNLGAIYADLARYQEPAANLQHSIVAYQQALEYRSADLDPIRYASTQNNLGTTYWNLAQHQQPQLNLKQAIAAYSAALEHYDPSVEPLTHAMIQNNLGTAYWNLSQYEQAPHHLRLSLAAYQAALQYRTLEAVPASFAATQNNLGTAYWHLSHHTAYPQERITYLRQAIAAYESTLAAAEYLYSNHPEAAELNFDLFSTHNNLGLAHYQLAVDRQAGLSTAEQTQALTLALQHHLVAQQGWEPNPNLRQTALQCIVQTVRAFYSHLGLPGQNQALAQIPGHLLAEILPQL